MNEPPKTLTQAVDDLRLIRQVLDQTATSFRTLAPEFFRMGVVWLVYGVLSCLVIWPDTLAFLFPEAFAGWDPTTGVPRVLSALLPWARVALWGYLLVQCILWQRKKGSFPALGGEGAGHLAGAAGALPPAVPAAGGGLPVPLRPAHVL